MGSIESSHEQDRSCQSSMVSVISQFKYFIAISMQPQCVLVCVVPVHTLYQCVLILIQVHGMQANALPVSRLQIPLASNSVSILGIKLNFNYGWPKYAQILFTFSKQCCIWHKCY